ncbi:MAG: hypothetical protein KC933_21500 [Myxococcales bacterium]|nr:hypothetical protein [Myxococcales bacterium]
MRILWAGALSLAACGGGERGGDPLPKETEPDSGVTIPVGLDAGLSNDAGVTQVPDSGEPPGPCPAGAEGCACTSSLGIDDEVLLQDTCQPGLLCVPWDVQSGRTELTGPVQSCVRPCNANTDCAVGQVCGGTRFGPESGAAKICLDRVAQYDEPCGLARSFDSRLPDVELDTPGEIVGCDPWSACLTGFFTDQNPDEGVCLALCHTDSDCGGPTPYCNPDVFADYDGQPVGICSTGKYGQGALCGKGTPTKLGLTSRCDTAPDAHPNLRCIHTPGVPEGKGTCIPRCNTTTELCRPAGPSGLPQTCVPFPEIYGPESDFVGLCSVTCDNLPDSCEGPGTHGLGQFCAGPFSYSEVGNSLTFCADRSASPWNLATYDSSGQVIRQSLDCSEDETRCPEPSFCVDDGAGGGMCAIGCSTTPEATEPTCAEMMGSATAVCAPIFSATTGVCGGA